MVVHVGAAAIAAGYYYSMVLKTDGTVWAAGRNDYGELGDGTYDARPTFVKVALGQCDTKVCFVVIASTCCISVSVR